MKIGVLCSGGDAPGMNPCLRAIVRAGEKGGDSIVGIRHGFQGLLNEEFWGGIDRRIDPREVSGFTNKGGAFLNSSRCKEMYEKEGPEKAAKILKMHRFDGLIVIGGNGSLTGALDVSKAWDGKVIGLPGTIDNDLTGTDYTIGFATAVETGVDAVDKLRDTAGSHDMMFLFEVMGRYCGDLASHIAVAAGCELVAVPEVKTDIVSIVEKLNWFKSIGKRSVIMVVAEGDDFGHAPEIMKALAEAGAPFEMRCVTLGHIQRGGIPCPTDRILATKLGYNAIDAMHKKDVNAVMVGEIAGQIVYSKLEEVIRGRRKQAVLMAELIEGVSV